jgi:hypothetical protein
MRELFGDTSGNDQSNNKFEIYLPFIICFTVILLVIYTLVHRTFPKLNIITTIVLSFIVLYLLILLFVANVH